MIKPDRTGWTSLKLLVVLALAAMFVPAAPAQVIRRGVRVQMIDVDGQAISDAGATLKTDPDLESILERAERHRQDGNYRVATHFWQTVLERSGDALYSTDGTTYFSLVQQVEKTLADLPPEGMQTYRITADANAQEILAQAPHPHDTQSLSEVVRLYFLSSLGDDAAFQLACIYLDRYDFIGARRLLEKILTQYPEPSIALDQIYLRLALCDSYLGQAEAARKSLRLAKESSPNVDVQLVNLIDSQIGTASESQSDTIHNAAWTMKMGNTRRYGVMPRLPGNLMDADLVAVWQYYFDPQEEYKWSDAKGSTLRGRDAYGASVLDTMTSAERRLSKAWREREWRPAGYLLVGKNKLYFKSAADLTAWDATAPSEQPLWRPLWRNQFQMDDATQMLINIRRSWGGFGRRQDLELNTQQPASIEEVQLFGDKIFQEMAIHNNTLYTIEGPRFDETPINAKKNATPNYNASFRRSRTNQLTAYDAETGIIQWTLPRDTVDSAHPDQAHPMGDQPENPWLDSAGFMSAPIGFGNWIIVPVNHGGAISVYALDPRKNGRTIWKSFLCDEPESGADPWSPIELSIDGSDLLVNPGTGVVFVLDPSTGMVRFARRYARGGEQDSSFARMGIVGPMQYSGWSEDVIVPYGRQMICFSSDSHRIQALDRNNGQLIWESELNPINVRVEYLLGVYGDVLYAAGRETIVAYDLLGEGRMLWGGEAMFGGEKSYGRGMLTPDGIYVPVGESIAKFDLKGNNAKPNLLAQVAVDLGTDAPVGNLFSDGRRIWVHGGNRLYALGLAEGNE